MAYRNYSVFYLIFSFKWAFKNSGDVWDESVVVNGAVIALLQFTGPWKAMYEGFLKEEMRRLTSDMKSKPNGSCQNTVGQVSRNLELNRAALLVMKPGTKEKWRRDCFL